MKLLITFFLLAPFLAIGQLTDSEIRDLKTGRIKEDTSYIYWLPYKKGDRHLFIQGANSSFSHKGELSFDFKMKKGSKICAARPGIVIATKSDSNNGGLKDEFLDDGNHIIVQHDDGSTAHYWHLLQNGVVVKIGDNVTKGQIIGYSGNTGYTAFPHLHFQLIDASGKEILPRFRTKRGSIYLRPGRWYKSVN
jgi:murein DD-endopeptidase MepM/ murein hydrolase activator NlpD